MTALARVPWRHIATRLGGVVLVLFAVRASVAGQDDPWKMLMERFGGAGQNQPAETTAAIRPADDPWARLRAVYLPFSAELDQAAKFDPGAREKVSGCLHSAVAPYSRLISEASVRFEIPRQIIAAVIMTESAGKADARATLSSAKGLMQTIDGTFNDAREHLKQAGLMIGDSPLDPRSSIMAGSWYLDRMYRLACSDGKITAPDRRNLSSWRYALEYYYAGPGNGRRPEPRILVYSGGKRRVIDKSAYSGQVLHWAEVMGGKA